MNEKSNILYKHKKTGRIVRKNILDGFCHSNYNYKTDSEVIELPKQLVEDTEDWELIKEKPKREVLLRVWDEYGKLIDRYQSDVVWGLNSMDWSIYSLKVLSDMSYIANRTYFSTEMAAKNYTLLHKPKYSQAEIDKLIKDIEDVAVKNRYFIFDLVKNILRRFKS